MWKLLGTRSGLYARWADTSLRNCERICWDRSNMRSYVVISHKHSRRQHAFSFVVNGSLQVTWCLTIHSHLVGKINYAGQVQEPAAQHKLMCCSRQGQTSWWGSCTVVSNRSAGHFSAIGIWKKKSLVCHKHIYIIWIYIILPHIIIWVYIILQYTIIWIYIEKYRQ